MYARSDQLIAGLDRAVDPNDDGDARDAVRVALVPLAEPFAGFPDGPEARAVAGALALDTLVVAPAGNDGAAGAGYGDVSGPGGAPAALTVGAADTRAADGAGPARRALRTGDALRRDRAARRSRRAAGAAEPRDRAAAAAAAFFSARGVSLVAGRAAFVAAGPSPLAAAERAVTAGASAVLLDRPLPAGGLGLDESAPVPVVSLPSGVARALRARLDAGATATVSLGSAAAAANADAGRVASFSSTGLAFDGRVKPDLVAPGVALATSDPGANADGSPRFVTVNGSSAAAAVVAGAAALLAQARPALDAAALAGLLAGTARALPDDPVTAQGGGLVDVGAAAAGRLAAAPATLAFGRGGETSFTLTNLSGRDLPVTLAVRRQDHGAAAARFSLEPARRGRPPGRERRRARCARTREPAAAPIEGVVVARVRGGGAIRVPWAIAPAARGPLLGAVSLAPAAFARVRHAARAADRRRRPRARRLRQPPRSVRSRASTSSCTARRASASDCSPGCATFSPAGSSSGSPDATPPGRCCRPGGTSSASSQPQ